MTTGSQCSPDTCSHTSQWSRFPISCHLSFCRVFATSLYQVSSAILPCPLHEFQMSGAHGQVTHSFPAVHEEWVHHSGAQVMHQRVLRSPCTSQRCRLHRSLVCSSVWRNPVTRLCGGHVRDALSSSPMQPSCPPASSCFHFQSSSEPQFRDMPPLFLH